MNSLQLHHHLLICSTLRDNEWEAMAVWVERNNILYPALYLSPHSVQFFLLLFFFNSQCCRFQASQALALATTNSVSLWDIDACIVLFQPEHKWEPGTTSAFTVTSQYLPQESTRFSLHLILTFMSCIFLDIFMKCWANLKRTYGHLFQVFDKNNNHTAWIENHIESKNSFPTSGPTFNSSICLKTTKSKLFNCLMGQMFDAPWWCQRLRVERFFGFNTNKYKSNFSSESNPASGTFELANRPKLCNELNKSLQDEVRVSCWDMLTTAAAAWGIDPQNLSLFRGKELDESPSSSHSLYLWLPAVTAKTSLLAEDLEPGLRNNSQARASPQEEFLLGSLSAR